MNQTLPKVIPKKKAAKLLEVHGSTLWRWHKTNKYPELQPVQYGPGFRRVGYELDSLIKFIKKFKIDRI